MVSAGVNSAEGNLSKQTPGLSYAFCGRALYAAEMRQRVQKNYGNTGSNNPAEVNSQAGNEKVQPRLSLTGAKGEDRIAMTRGEPALTTTIELKKVTKAALDKIGHKGDTYDDIINILLVERKAAQIQKVESHGVKGR